MLTDRIVLDAAGRIGAWSGSVLPEWIDYNGHMTEFRYAQVFSDSTDAILSILGVDFGSAGEGAYYTLETHIRHIAECRIGTGLVSATELLGYDEKRLHLFHRLCDESGGLVATGEHLLIHVRHAEVVAASADKRALLAAIFAAQAHLPVPERAGSVLRRPLTHTRLS